MSRTRTPQNTRTPQTRTPQNTQRTLLKTRTPQNTHPPQNTHSPQNTHVQDKHSRCGVMHSQLNVFTHIYFSQLVWGHALAVECLVSTQTYLIHNVVKNASIDWGFAPALKLAALWQHTKTNLHTNTQTHTRTHAHTNT